MNKSYFYVTLCYIVWGVLPVFWKQLAGVNSIYVLTMRVVWSMVFCGAIIFVRRDAGLVRAALADRKQFIWLVLAGIFVTVNWGLYIYAVNNGHILDASLAYYMNPILSILLGRFMFKEKLSILQWCAVALAAAGVIYSTISYGTAPYFALMIASTFAIYTAIKKKVTVDSDVSIFMETAVVTPLAIAAAIYMEVNGMGVIGSISVVKLTLLPLAGVVTSVPLLFFAKGMKGTPMSLSGILMYINPTLVLLVGVLLYDENFTMTNAVMFCCVWAAVIIYIADMMYTHHRGKSAVEGVTNEAS